MNKTLQQQLHDAVRRYGEAWIRVYIENDKLILEIVTNEKITIPNKEPLGGE